jgi:hypothetical protein
VSVFTLPFIVRTPFGLRPIHPFSDGKGLCWPFIWILPDYNTFDSVTVNNWPTLFSCTSEMFHSLECIFRYRRFIIMGKGNAYISHLKSNDVIGRNYIWCTCLKDRCVEEDPLAFTAWSFTRVQKVLPLIVLSKYNYSKWLKFGDNINECFFCKYYFST